eukprot:4421436-Amphidinium_carterae.5
MIRPMAEQYVAGRCRCSWRHSVACAPKDSVPIIEHRCLQPESCGEDVQIACSARSPRLSEVCAVQVVLYTHAQQIGRFRQRSGTGRVMRCHHVASYGVSQAAERSYLGPAVAPPEIEGQALEQTAVLADGI